MFTKERVSPNVKPDPVACVFVIQTLFQYVTSLMKQGYQEESSRQRQLTLSPRDRPEKSNTALWASSSSASLSNSAQHSDVSLYILYLLSRFLRRSCLPQSLFAIRSKNNNHTWSFNNALYFWTQLLLRSSSMGPGLGSRARPQSVTAAAQPALLIVMNWNYY